VSPSAHRRRRRARPGSPDGRHRYLSRPRRPSATACCSTGERARRGRAAKAHRPRAPGPPPAGRASVLPPPRVAIGPQSARGGSGRDGRRRGSQTAHPPTRSRAAARRGSRSGRRMHTDNAHEPLSAPRALIHADREHGRLADQRRERAAIPGRKGPLSTQYCDYAQARSLGLHLPQLIVPDLSRQGHHQPKSKRAPPPPRARVRRGQRKYRVLFSRARRVLASGKSAQAAARGALLRLGGRRTSLRSPLARGLRKVGSERCISRQVVAAPVRSRGGCTAVSKPQLTQEEVSLPHTTHARWKCGGLPAWEV
jgi:hypothetical protein